MIISKLAKYGSTGTYIYYWWECKLFEKFKLAVQWVERWLPKRYVHTLTPRTCEQGLIWKKGLHRCNKVKDLEKSRIIWESSKYNDKWHRHRREGHAKIEAEIRVIQPQGIPTVTQSWKRKKGILLRVFRRISALLVHWFQTSSLQNSQRTNFCCNVAHLW